MHISSTSTTHLLHPATRLMKCCQLLSDQQLLPHCQRQPMACDRPPTMTIGHWQLVQHQHQGPELVVSKSAAIAKAAAQVSSLLVLPPQTQTPSACLALRETLWQKVHHLLAEMAQQLLFINCNLNLKWSCMQTAQVVFDLELLLLWFPFLINFHFHFDFQSKALRIFIWILNQLSSLDPFLLHTPLFLSLWHHRLFLDKIGQNAEIFWDLEGQKVWDEKYFDK